MMLEVETEPVIEVVEVERPPCARPFQRHPRTGEVRWACQEETHPADWAVVLSCGCIVYACDLLLEAVHDMPQVCGTHLALGMVDIAETLPL